MQVVRSASIRQKKRYEIDAARTLQGLVKENRLIPRERKGKTAVSRYRKLIFKITHSQGLVVAFKSLKAHLAK